MTVDQMVELFKIMSIINVSMLLLSVLFLRYCKRFINKIAVQCFDLEHEAINNANYICVGFFEVLVIVFNVVPYIALLFIR